MIKLGERAAYPSGKYGLYSDVNNVKFDRFAIFNDAEWPSLADRWINHTGQAGYNAIDTSTDRLKMNKDSIGVRAPIYLKGVRVKRFEAIFNVKREVLGSGNNIAFCV